MASLAKDPNGRKRILFMAKDGSRKTIRLGKTSIKQAESFKVKLEPLIAARRTKSSGGIDAETALWIFSLTDEAHAKLAAVGLLKEKITATLGAFLDHYLESRTDLKPNSQKVYDHTRRNLIDFFGYDKSLNEIKPKDAQAWRFHLTERASKKKKPLSKATINKRCANAKVFFDVAIKRKLVASNPFTDLDSRSIANKDRQYFLERKDADKIFDTCPDAQWRLIFALCRYGGLRCPSEVLGLRWSDVNWEQRRLLVHSPKTERHEGRESRIIPMFPEIMPYLQEVFEAAEPGTNRVITRYRDANQNLRTTFQKIIKRAGLKPWPRLFQNLRASRETELASKYPLHIATAWIGNTARIAERHYLQIPDEFFETAVAVDEDAADLEAAHNAAHAAHFTAQHSAAPGGRERQANRHEGYKNADLPLVAVACDSVQNAQVETKGIEPSFPRCDRGVLPLHHVPETTF